MTINKRKKNTRHRGTRTCGWGLVHRGSGQKGGVGRAGSGKKADCKKPSFDPASFGKHGFKIRGAKKPEKPINILTIMRNVQNWKEQKLVEEKEGVTVIDLNKLGYTKLLSDGKPTKKVKLLIHQASKNSIEKLKTAGCEVVTL